VLNVPGSCKFAEFSPAKLEAIVANHLVGSVMSGKITLVS